MSVRGASLGGMAVTSQTSRVPYIGNAATTAFPTTFPFLDADDLVVQLAANDDAPYATLTKGLHYSVSGEGDEDGGTVVMLAAPGIGAVLRITRQVPLTQETEFGTHQFSAAAHTKALDKLTMGLQQIDRDSTDALAALRAELLAALAEASVVGGAVDSSLVTATGTTTARSLADRFAMVFNVDDFGALGNGSADDTTPIRNTVSAAQSAQGGKVIGTRGKRYRITDSINVGIPFVAVDDLVYGPSYTLAGCASFNVTNLTNARATAWVDFDFNGATIHADWSSSTGKAAINYAVSTSVAKANVYNGTIENLVILGKEGLGADPTTPLPGTNHQVGIQCVLAPLNVRNVIVREMSRGFVTSDCYWSIWDHNQAEHCTDGFTMLGSNAVYGRQNLASGCRGVGHLIQGQTFDWMPQTENCAVQLWVPNCDNGRISGGYLESVYTSDTDFAVKIGDPANGSTSQVIGLSIADLHVATLYGKGIKFHSAPSVELDNVRTYTQGVGYNSYVNNKCGIDVRGRTAEFDRSPWDHCVSHFIPGSGGPNGGNVSLGVRAPGDPGFEAGPNFTIGIKVATPSNIVATPGSAGTLANATYYYVIIAFNVGGGQSDRALEVSAVVTAGGTGSVALTWDAVQGADRYYVYRGTVSGAENKRYIVSTNSYTDTGAAAVDATPDPSAGSLRSVQLSAFGDSWHFSTGKFGFGRRPDTYKYDFNDIAGFRSGLAVGAFSKSQRDALTSFLGQAVYNSSSKTWSLYTGSTWNDVTTDGSISARNYGAKGDDSTDDTAAIQAALTYGSANGKLVVIPPGTYRISSSLLLADVSGFAIRGAGKGNCLLKWVGASGTPMFKVTNSQHVSIESMRFQGNTTGANRPSAYIESSSDTSYGRTYVPTAMTLRDMVLGSGAANEATYGVVYSNTGASSDTNNSEGLFLGVLIQGITEAGYSFQHSQSKAHAIIGGGVVGCKAAVATNRGAGGGGGSFAYVHAAASNCSVACFDLGGPNDPIYVERLTSEGSARLCQTSGTGGGTYGITFQSCRFSTDALHADQKAIKYTYRGPLNVIGCIFDSGGSPANIELTFSTDGVANIIGNAWNSVNSNLGTRIVIASAAGHVNLQGNVYSDAVGAMTVQERSGTVSVADAATTASVTFSVPEHDTNYRPALSPITLTGSPAAGATRVRSIAKSTTGFVATLEAAPGAGTAVAFDWAVARA